MIEQKEQPPQGVPVQEQNPSVQSQDWAGVAKKSIMGMTPAETGWILAFVMLFAIFQISNFLTGKERQQSEVARSDNLVAYFNRIEESRVIIEQNRAQEIRRLQEVVKELSQAVARQHEYQGRAQHEAKLLEKKEKGKAYE